MSWRSATGDMSATAIERISDPFNCVCVGRLCGSDYRHDLLNTMWLGVHRLGYESPLYGPFPT
jgi:hypothetical protein